MTVVQIHVYVRGKVQGVGFRYATMHKARSLQLTGWTRNREDGRVEIVAEGSETATSELVRWCAQGPALAKVDEVVLAKKQFLSAAQFPTFTIE